MDFAEILKGGKILKRGYDGFNRTTKRWKDTKTWK